MPQDIQYFYDILVVDISISAREQKRYNFIPNNLDGIWYFDNINKQEPFVIYIHLGEDIEFLADDDSEEDFSYNINLFPDSIVSISPSQEVRFYGRMIN